MRNMTEALKIACETLAPQSTVYEMLVSTARYIPFISQMQKYNQTTE